MKFSSFEMLAKKLEGDKRLKIALIGGVVIIALLLFFISSGADSCSAKKGAAAQMPAEVKSDASELLEGRLESILSKMAGVGRVKVMVSLERTSEQVVASSSKSANSEKSASSESHPATVQSGGREEPIVLAEVFPTVRGVIVIAEGAYDFGVKLNIVSAVSTVLGIDQKLVEVFVMSG